LTLSVEANLNRNYLSDLERGRRNPTLKVLEKIAFALSIDLATLFKGIKAI
jgi:transcriptional regulator with XRE-family HTH domain